MKVLYFAWVRDQIGKNVENIAPPKEIETVEQLIDWLSARSSKHEATLRNKKKIRVAVNYDFARLEDRIMPNDEVAIFPPITGG